MIAKFAGFILTKIVSFSSEANFQNFESIRKFEVL